jgi:hypothetical protein
MKQRRLSHTSAGRDIDDQIRLLASILTQQDRFPCGRRHGKVEDGRGDLARRTHHIFLERFGVAHDEETDNYSQDNSRNDYHGS